MAVRKKGNVFVPPDARKPSTRKDGRVRPKKVKKLPPLTKRATESDARKAIADAKKRAKKRDDAKFLRKMMRQMRAFDARTGKKL